MINFLQGSETLYNGIREAQEEQGGDGIRFMATGIVAAQLMPAVGQCLMQYAELPKQESGFLGAVIAMVFVWIFIDRRRNAIAEEHVRATPRARTVLIFCFLGGAAAVALVANISGALGLLVYFVVAGLPLKRLLGLRR